MTPISFKRHRLPPESIQHAVWIYARFTPSYCDVEDLLAERGIDVSNETIRRWLLKLGQRIDASLRRSRPLRSPFVKKPLSAVHDQGLRANNRAENSHRPVRQRVRKQLRFKSPGSAHRFLSIHAVVYNAFYIQRHLLKRRYFKHFRAHAFAVWNQSWLVA